MHDQRAKVGSVWLGVERCMMVLLLPVSLCLCYMKYTNRPAHWEPVKPDFNTHILTAPHCSPIKHQANT